MLYVTSGTLPARKNRGTKFRLPSGVIYKTTTTTKLCVDSIGKCVLFGFFLIVVVAKIPAFMHHDS